MLKFAIKTIGISGLFVGLLYMVGIIHNSYGNKPVPQSQVESSLDNAIEWVLSHDSKILDTHNPPLIEMLAQAAQLTNNEQLAQLLSRYRVRHQLFYADHPLRFQVYGSGYPNYRNANLMNFPFYNYLMMYGFSCDKSLLDYQTVKHQLDPQFCQKRHPWASACKTHQLMGFNYLRAKQCEDPAFVEDTITILSNDIEQQLWRDIRVIDIYIQRLLLLYQSGYEEKIRHRWIERVIHAQNQDGGWDNFMPVIGSSSNKALGVSTKAIRIDRPRSNFHATIQGLLVMSLYRHNQPSVE